VAGARLEQLDQLRDQLDNLRDWSGGGNGTAVESLLEILTAVDTTVRQRLRASNAILSYKTEPRVGAFVKGFLEDVCGNASILVDYRVEAAEQLRRCEGAPRIMSAIERPDPSPPPPVDPAKEAEERRLEHERKRQHIEKQAAIDAEELKLEWQRLGWSRSRD
jgi:hypothetical protein